jgi:hypothetical protein
MDKILKQKLDALEGSYASPRQTLNIIRTAIIPSLAYAFAVTPCSYPDLDKWDAVIGRVIKSKHNLWRSTLTAIIREDVHSFGLGAPSIYVEYHRRSTVALVTSLEDPSERHQSVTVLLLTHQVAQLKALATTFLSTREGTLLPLPTKERRYQYQERCYQYQGTSLPIPRNVDTTTNEGMSLPIPIKRLHSFPQDKKRCYTNKMAT